MNQSADFQRLSDQQVPHAIALIGRAFSQDPLSIYTYPQEAERVRYLPSMFSVALRYTMRYGEITMTPEGTGIACWLPPENILVTIGRLVRIGVLQTAFQMGSLSALLRMKHAEDYMAKLHQRCMAEPHWYLWVLGVEPDYQGQGIGSRLLRVGLERVDAADLPCYLDTTNKNNVALYQKFGFVVAHEGAIPGSPVHVWGMIRPARVRGPEHYETYT